MEKRIIVVPIKDIVTPRQRLASLGLLRFTGLSGFLYRLVTKPAY